MDERDQQTSLIRSKAYELGFSACGFSPVAHLKDQAVILESWLEEGNAGEMDYLHRYFDLRTDPGKLVPGAKTVISLLAGYYHQMPPHQDGTPRFSRYAAGADYHKVLRRKGRELLRFINEEIAPVNGRFFTDSGPVLEKEWARKAGLGWIGRNSCLIVPGAGSWFFIAELIIDLELPAPSATLPNRCGNCMRCVDACPTGALFGNGSLDSRKCISYLTIEKKSEIESSFKGLWKDWIFGCDICQEVCPWNRVPLIAGMMEFAPDPSVLNLGFPELDHMTDEEFDAVFRDSPVKRTGLSGIRRNIKFVTKQENNDR